MPLHEVAVTLALALACPAVAAEDVCAAGTSVCAGADHSLLQRQAIVVKEVPFSRSDAHPAAIQAAGAVRNQAEAMGFATSSENEAVKVRRASSSTVLFPETGRAVESARRRRRSEAEPLPGAVSDEGQMQKLSLIGVGQGPAKKHVHNERKRYRQGEPGAREGAWDVAGPLLDTLEVDTDDSADSVRRDGARWWFWGRRRRTGETETTSTSATTTIAAIESVDDFLTDEDNTDDASEADEKFAPEVDDDVANSMDSELEKKADRTYVDAELAEKADRSWVGEELRMVVDKYITPLEQKLGDSTRATLAEDADAPEPPSQEDTTEAEAEADHKEECHVEYSVPACGACADSQQCACVLSPGGPGNFCCPWTGRCSCGGGEEPATCESPVGFEQKKPTCKDGTPSRDTNEILLAHNKYRCIHGAPPLRWSPAIAEHAQAWADQLDGVMRHSSSDDRLNAAGFEYLGENVAKGLTGAKAVDHWYSEVQDTDRGRVSGFSRRWGHYTQVVWKTTTHIGCAIRNGVTVCQYGPGGNSGNYERDVSGPSKSAAECESLG